MLQSVGLPPALTIPTALFEILLGIALGLGMMTRLTTLLLAGFTVLTILFFHNRIDDPAQVPTILLHVALIGGLLGIFAHSQLGRSYDALRHRRDEDLARHDRDAEERVHDAEVRAARAEGRVDGHADPVLPPEPAPRRRRWF